MNFPRRVLALLCVGTKVTRCKEGDRIAVCAITPCGHCAACQRGFPSQCGGTMLGGIKFELQREGNLAEYFFVNDAGVSSRTRFLNRSSAFGAIRRFGSFPSVKLKPRNFRSHGLATALLSPFTLSLSFLTMKPLMLSITRFPARSLRALGGWLMRTAHVRQIYSSSQLWWLTLIWLGISGCVLGSSFLLRPLNVPNELLIFGIGWLFPGGALARCALNLADNRHR